MNKIQSAIDKECDPRNVLDGSLNRKTYLTCTQLAKKYPWPPLGGLRHLIFNADRNGFQRCVKRVGRRVLIDEGAFIDFIEGKENEMLLK